MKRELRLTKDGSHSIYIPEMDEQYHSMHGSIVEAEKVYIEYGLVKILEEEANYIENVRLSGVEASLAKKGSLKILEMGFGTGLNALLTFQKAEELGLEVFYYGLEKYPLENDEIRSLNYSKIIEDQQGVYTLLHEADWEKWVDISPTFHLKKRRADLREIEFDQQFDLVYFDAFAPEKQPHLWTEEIFSKIYNAMNDGAILTTYCVKGEIRRRLQSVGFSIEKLSGPIGGKREVLRAVKKVESRKQKSEI